MNLFRKKNFFNELKSSNSSPYIKTFKLNTLKQKISSSRNINTILLNNFSPKLIFNPKLSLKLDTKILKINSLSNTKENFTSKNSSTKFKTLKNFNKNLINEKEFLTQKNIRKLKNEKVVAILSEIINWDNKQLIENDEQFKDVKDFCEQEKKILNMQRIISENINYFNAKTLTNAKENNKNSSKFSLFNQNVSRNIGKVNNITKDNSTLNNIIDTEKANIKFENSNFYRLMKIYEYIKTNKLKKRKYKEIIDSTSDLLNQAKKESELSVDLLKERIKSVQKYYEAYIQSYSQIKDIKDKKIKVYEEKIIKYREYLDIYEEINEKIKKYKDNYNIIKVDLMAFIDEIKKKIEIITKEINKYKYIFNELKDQQIKYYLRKLKKGEDTRKEGLIWIILKLKELKANIEPILFPEYLDEEQVEYLIKISNLIFESNQLRIIFKTFKEQEQTFLNGKYNKMKNNNIKIKKIKMKNLDNQDKSLAGDINFEIDFDSCFNEFIKEKGIKNQKIIELQKKFKKKEGFNSIIKRKTEDNILNIITKRIRNRMNLFAVTNDNKILEEIKKHDIKSINQETEFFKDCAQINRRILKLDEVIEKLKNEEYLIFKEKIKLFDEKDKEKKYEIIYKALFGDIIFDFESAQKIEKK